MKKATLLILILLLTVSLAACGRPADNPGQDTLATADLSATEETAPVESSETIEVPEVPE